VIVGDPIVGAALGPGHQIAEFEGHRFPSSFLGNHAELIGHGQQLFHEGLTEAGVVGDLGLPCRPEGDGAAIGGGAPVACGDRLQGAQPMGKEPQMVPLKGRQKGALQLRQLAFREDLHRIQSGLPMPTCPPA